MSPYVPLYLCESARPGRVAKVMEWGFTLRQARFLTHVLVYSGVFLERQYCAFAGIAHGQKTHDFLAKLGPRSGGTFRVDLIDLAIGTEHLVAVQHATASHDGKQLDITACQLIKVEDGRIVEVRGHYSDQYALDGFWS